MRRGGHAVWLTFSGRPRAAGHHRPSPHREVRTVAEIHHFTHGWFNPVAAFLMAFLGSLLGLFCTARARQARTRGRRARWLVIAAVTIGGAGIWLMHFMAMLGVEVPHSPIRYDPVLTLVSMMLAVLPVGIGLFLVSGGRRSASRLLVAGLCTGLGVLAMHYTGISALRVAGTTTFDPALVAASGAIAIVAATLALWFSTRVTGWGPIFVAAVIMAVAVCGMHYTGMAALRVQLSPEPVLVDGISPFLLIVPITLISAAALIAMAFTALQAMTEEEFDGAVWGRHRGDGTVQTQSHWKLQEDRPVPAIPTTVAPANAAIDAS